MSFTISRAVLLGSALIVAVSVFGCDDTDTSVVWGDCRDPGRSCFAPFRCVPWWEDQHRCFSPSGDSPACHGIPEGQAVPFALAHGTDVPIHWALPETCIPVSHRPGFGGLMPDIEGALAAWEAISCSSICFGAPFVAEEDPDLNRLERRVHIKSAVLPVPDAIRVTTSYEPQTGRMQSAVIEIDTRRATPPQLAQLVTVFGRILGLDSAATGTDSVMTDAGLTAPTALDQEAVCLLYGTPSYCGD